MCMCVCHLQPLCTSPLSHLREGVRNCLLVFTVCLLVLSLIFGSALTFEFTSVRKFSFVFSACVHKPVRICMCGGSLSFLPFVSVLTFVCFSDVCACVSVCVFVCMYL